MALTPSPDQAINFCLFDILFGHAPLSGLPHHLGTLLNGPTHPGTVCQTLDGQVGKEMPYWVSLFFTFVTHCDRPFGFSIDCLKTLA